MANGACDFPLQCLVAEKGHNWEHIRRGRNLGKPCVVAVGCFLYSAVASGMRIFHLADDSTSECWREWRGGPYLDATAPPGQQRKEKG